ncbi:hypothetical protein CPC16_002173 [Podila verticillata]|nr:hypothetical protein CPC16_002173 [Podila verticillata]
MCLPLDLSLFLAPLADAQTRFENQPRYHRFSKQQQRLIRRLIECITNLRVLTVGGFIKRRAQRTAIFTDITQPYLEVLDLFAVHIQDRPDHNATKLFSENYLQRIKQIAMDMPLFVDDEKAKPFINEEAPAG